MATGIPPEFVVRLTTRDKQGNVTGHQEFVTYQGLLAIAHEQGLKGIETTLLQVPGSDNGHTAIVRAAAHGPGGTFTGLGDASPTNVSARVARHLVRVAETRAKARALRDLTNVAMVALDEVADFDEAARPPRQQRNADDVPATPQQRRELVAKAAALGMDRGALELALRQRHGTDLANITSGLARHVAEQMARETHARRAAE